LRQRGGMDTDRIKEIKKISFNEKEEIQLKLPIFHWLSIKQNKFNQIFVKVNNDIIFFLFDSSTKTICNKEGLNDLFKILNLDVNNLNVFRIYLRETKKWGVKPLFIDATNNICFKYQYKTFKNKGFLILYNTNGSRNIESIYIHGIWQFNLFSGVSNNSEEE